MARSLEYPNLRFVPARAYGTGRDGKAVRYIVIHYTAGSERATSAEDGAVYDQRRTDGTSTHYFVDQNSIVQCVLTKDRANAARHKGNRLGIQYELCGTVQTRDQWLDTASLSTLKLAAKQVARDCMKYDLPPRRLSVAETRRAWTEYPDGPRGIVGHVDCTHAYPEDGGDHTDPGAAFPWDVFLPLVADEIENLQQEESMALTQADIDAIWSKDLNASPTASNLAYTTVFATFQNVNSLASQVSALQSTVNSLATAISALGASLAAVTSGVDSLTADPFDTGEAHPGVQVGWYLQENPTPPAP